MDPQLNEFVGYVAARRNEQREDNAKQESPVVHIGVDYHVHRKAIARYLVCEMKVNRRFPHVFTLSKEGKEFYTRLLATGVWKQTVHTWLRKYEDINVSVLIK